MYVVCYIVYVCTGSEDVIDGLPSHDHFSLIDVTDNYLCNTKRSRLLFTY